MSEEMRNTAPFLTDPVAQRKIRELWNHEKNAPIKAGNPLPTLAPADTISYCTLGILGTFSMAAQGGDAPPERQKDEGGKEDGACIVTNPYVHTTYSRAIQVLAYQETFPSEFRLLHKRTGAYVLQGGFKSYRNGDLCGIEWRDFPTVEEEPEKPKNAWATTPTKWSDRR